MRFGPNGKISHFNFNAQFILPLSLLSHTIRCENNPLDVLDRRQCYCGVIKYTHIKLLRCYSLNNERQLNFEIGEHGTSERAHSARSEENEI